MVGLLLLLCAGCGGGAAEPVAETTIAVSEYQDRSVCRANASVAFVNRSSGTREVVWVDYEGRSKLLGTLPPGAVWEQTLTCFGHVWVIRDGAGVERMRFVVSESTRTVNLD